MEALTLDESIELLLNGPPEDHNPATFERVLNSINLQVSVCKDHLQECRALLTTSRSTKTLEDLIELQHELYDLQQWQAGVEERAKSVRERVRDIESMQWAKKDGPGEAEEGNQASEEFVEKAKTGLNKLFEVLDGAEEKLGRVERVVEGLAEKLRDEE